MKRFYKALVIALFVISLQSLSLHMQETANAEDGDPPYAKWGQLAMQETKENYPNAQIVDYLHVGSQSGDNTTIQEFKLWLQEESREFGVYITIEFNSETEEVLSITFEETPT
ncbi:hypothetical protein J2Z83_003454 [Virgibacillus natechei]|uniref:DUF3889 domain-containing protein n=1 Tax=Virgibacillus natechei TaxID=1216297 RepID=A0ABS4IL83_9BACI|nr:YqzG/YhdC family protein [Virgibacillus natechei]MBP1971315.1 hypothetical protein [Virgibacillus natechei]UZD12950.1 YqzG/YhdC family protein [Virgibacillus natechei]